MTRPTGLNAASRSRPAVCTAFPLPLWGSKAEFAAVDPKALQVRHYLRQPVQRGSAMMPQRPISTSGDLTIVQPLGRDDPPKKALSPLSTLASKHWPGRRAAACHVISSQSRAGRERREHPAAEASVIICWRIIIPAICSPHPSSWSWLH